MKFDITKPALSSEEIKQKRVELSANMAAFNIKIKRRVQGALIVVICALIIAATANALFELFPWATFSAVVAAVAVASIFVTVANNERVAIISIDVGFGAAIVSFCVAALATVFTLITTVITAVLASLIESNNNVGIYDLADIGAAVFAAVLALAVINRLITVKQKKIALDKLYVDLSDIGKIGNSEVEKWLADKAIATFHERISKESRLPIVGEINAMRRRWECSQSMKDARTVGEIEAAYRKFYGSPIVNE